MERNRTDIITNNLGAKTIQHFACAGEGEGFSAVQKWEHFFRDGLAGESNSEIQLEVWRRSVVRRRAGTTRAPCSNRYFMMETLVSDTIAGSEAEPIDSVPKLTRKFSEGEVSIFKRFA